MAAPPPYTFSRPAEARSDPEFGHATRFAEVRRDELVPVLSPRSPGVVTVTDGPVADWETVFSAAATSLLSGVPGVPAVALRGAYVRSAMRGSGRPRFR